MKSVKYLPDGGQSVHDQKVLSILVQVVQVEHRQAKVIQEEALSPCVARVKRVHDDRLCAFDRSHTGRKGTLVRPTPVEKHTSSFSTFAAKRCTVVFRPTYISK